MTALSDSREELRGRYMGERRRKHRGDRFLTGRGCYIDDVDLPGAVFMAVVRSEYPHARIRGVDLSRVRADPRCIVALDGVAGLELAEPVPHYFSADAFGGQHNDVRVLATGKVNYVGQPVAAVVGPTRNDAEALARLVDVDYEPIAFVLDAELALQSGAPLVYDEWHDNLVLRVSYPHGDFAAAAAEADNVLEEEFSIQRYSSQPMEPRGYAARWDARAERLTFWGSSQNPHPMRWVLAQALRLDEDQVRVVAPDIGGGFGLKMHGHPEEALICVLSRLVPGRPVKWIEDRSESLLIGARQHRHRFAVAFNDDGNITGFKDHLVANIGAVTAVPGWGMAMLTALVFPTGYEIPNTDVDVRIVTTNQGPWSPTRGYGKEGTNLIMERAMDLVAEHLGMEPAEVRRQNLLRPEQLPYRTNGGLNLDSGDYPEALERALALGDYDGFAERRSAAATEGRHLGFGIAFELTPEAADIPNSLVGGFDSCTVRMAPTGRVQIFTGVTTPGGGNDTGISQVVADELGVEMSSITITQGDTDLCPYGFGNSSGRSTVVGVGAALLASREIAGKLRKAAGILLEAAPDEVNLGDGFARAGDRSMALSDVAWQVYSNAYAEMAGVSPPLEATKAYQPENIDHHPDDLGRIQPYPTYSYAVHVAEVEVDVETGVTHIERFGVVHDCGTMINPLLVEGQMHGAATMGIGAALSETQRFDADGRLINDRLKTYLMPRATDVPSIAIGHMVTPSPYTMLGVKGAGEAGVGGAQAAVVNAVNDALRPLGALVRSTPADPPTVLRAIRAERGGSPRLTTYAARCRARQPE